MTITDNFMELIHVKLLALYDTCLTAKGGGCVPAISSHLISQLSNLKKKKKKKAAVPLYASKRDYFEFQGTTCF